MNFIESKYINFSYSFLVKEKLITKSEADFCRLAEKNGFTVTVNFNDNNMGSSLPAVEIKIWKHNIIKPQK